MPDGRDRLIVALDLPTAAQALQIASAVGDSARIFKVGKQLFTAEGPQVVRRLVASGREVFLDLKFHDIPNTVAAAVREASKLGVSMLTVHASGGLRMIQAAVQASVGAEFIPPTDRVGAEFIPPNSGGGPRPLILAVTVLTSLTDDDLQQIGVSGRVLDQALRLGALARNAGCDGIIASAREARELRRELGAGFLIVTPGIRPAGAPFATRDKDTGDKAAGDKSAGDKAAGEKAAGEKKDDQVRIVTPAEAIAAGASHLVVGRPITAAPDPSAAARRIVEEIDAALAQQAQGSRR
jgi:orotidine-5'-phosphate decarboxylase